MQGSRFGQVFWTCAVTHVPKKEKFNVSPIQRHQTSKTVRSSHVIKICYLLFSYSLPSYCPFLVSASLLFLSTAVPDNLETFLQKTPRDRTRGLLSEGKANQTCFGKLKKSSSLYL